jgi:RNA polymerase sigma factor (sigma-70 family)
MGTTAKRDKRRINSHFVSRSASPIFKKSDTSLSAYLKSVGSQSALDATEEKEAAKELMVLEKALWETVFSNPITANKLLRFVARELGAKERTEAVEISENLIVEALKTTSKIKRQMAIEALAGLLSEVDEDRELITVVTKYADAIHQTSSNNGNEMVEHMSLLREASMRLTGAKHRFIQENLGLVVNIAKRYHVDQMPLADLIQEGNIGLMRAVDKFDYRKGFRFSTYASWWIRSYISRAIVRKSSTVRIPEYMLRDRNRMKRTVEAGRAKLGRSLSEEELANELGVSQKRLNRTQKHDVAFVESLDREMPGNDHQKYIDFLPDEDGKNPFEATDLNSWIKSIPQRLSELNPTERFVISWRFGLVDGEEMTLQDIGTSLGLSRERVRQIQEEALAKLRVKLEVDAA